MCILVTCKNCGGSIPIGVLKFSYQVKAEKIGKAKRCSKCNSYSYKGNKRFDWWFCCKKCLVEFLGKTTEKDYKYDWEETSYQIGKVYEDEKNQLGET